MSAIDQTLSGTGDTEPGFCLFVCFLAAMHGMWDLSSETWDQIHAPLQWKYRILTTGPPGKSPEPGFYTPGGHTHLKHTFVRIGKQTSQT